MTIILNSPDNDITCSSITIMETEDGLVVIPISDDHTHEEIIIEDVNCIKSSKGRVYWIE